MYIALHRRFAADDKEVDAPYNLSDYHNIFKCGLFDRMMFPYDKRFAFN